MKGDPYDKGAEKLDKLSSTVGWKIELIINELGYLAEEISKHNMDAVALFLIVLIVNCEKLRKDLISKKEPELDGLENSQPISIEKEREREWWGGGEHALKRTSRVNRLLLNRVAV